MTTYWLNRYDSYTFEGMIENELSGNPCNDFLGELEEMKGSINAIKRFLSVTLEEVLTKEQKESLANKLGYEMVEG